MLRFLGYELELFAVGLITRRPGFTVRYGADVSGGQGRPRPLHARR
jgi:hypothetical protein